MDVGKLNICMPIKMLPELIDLIIPYALSSETFFTIRALNHTWYNYATSMADFKQRPVDPAAWGILTSTGRYSSGLIICEYTADKGRLTKQITMKSPLGGVTWGAILEFEFYIHDYTHKTPAKGCEFIRDVCGWSKVFGNLASCVEIHLLCECAQCVAVNQYHNCDCYPTPQILKLELLYDNTYMITFACNLTVHEDGGLWKGLVKYVDGKWGNIIDNDNDNAYPGCMGHTDFDGNYQWLLSSIAFGSA